MMLWRGSFGGSLVLIHCYWSSQQYTLAAKTAGVCGPLLQWLVCLSEPSFYVKQEAIGSTHLGIEVETDYVLMTLGSLGAFGHGLAFPIFFLFFGKLVNSFGSTQSTPEKTAEEVGKYSLDLVYLGIVILGSAWAEVACWMHTGQRQTSKMRLNYLRAILSQEVGFFDMDTRTGMLVDSIARDTVLVQDAISEKVGNFLQYVGTLVGGFGVGFSLQWKLCLVLMALVPAIAFAGGLYAYTLTRLTAKSQETYGNAGAIVEQTIGQIRTVYSFAGEKRAAQAFSESLALTLKLGYKGGLAKGLGIGVTFTILFFSWALILWYGGVLVRRKETTGGKAISAIFSAIIGGMALGQAMGNISAFSKGKVAAYKIMEMVNKPMKMDCNLDNGLKLPEVKGDIELRNVVFSYPSRPDVVIFNNFSLSIPSGRTVALVGGSGSGKSTVVSLVERFYDPQQGQVLVDAVDIRTLHLRWLRDQIGLVNQEPALFATSILGNILYGKEDATIEEVEAAAKAANAHTYISELPDGYQTQVGERGVQLSGGQKQRVAIARAMLKNPKVLLLDEATSALDAASERVVQDALDRLMVGRTTLIIAHRLSTIQGEMALASDGTILGRKSRHGSSLASVSSARGSFLSKSHRMSSDRRLSRQGSNRSSVDQELDEQNEGKFEKDKERMVSKGSFWRLMKLNGPEWPYAFLGSLGSILAGVVNPVFALLISGLLQVYYDTDIDQMKKDIEKYVLIFVGIGVVTVGIYLLQHYFFGVVGENLTARVRELMFRAMTRNEVGWFDADENNSKRLAARLSTDATHVRAAIGDRVSLLLQNSTAFITACIIGFILQWRLSLVLLSTFPLLIAASFGQQLCMQGFGGDLNEAHARSSMIAGDAISNIRTVAAFNAETKVVSLFLEALVIKVFMVLAMTAFAVAEALSLTPDIIKGSDALVSVFRIIDRQTLIDPNEPSSEVVTSVHGHIKLIDIEFAYPTRPEVTIFKGFNLNVPAGHSLALVGASGSGKSSVIGLIERFYDPTAGVVTIDGKDIGRLNLQSVRQHIGLVQQEPALFATTIYENIAYGREGASEAEVEVAAQAANAHSFITGLPGGYKTEVGERGVQLSGGQKQRVAIARAVLKNPGILLLDEATSALDAESESIVQAALDKLMKGRTTVVVAHRLTTIRNADTIAVVQDGRIIDEGSHNDLISKPGGSYARLVNLQRAREGRNS
ncbi:hypothetical protein L7F22_046641 [Adiantum nelumboides]|nr:hypothetical protein [Adiantum nelumboides]